MSPSDREDQEQSLDLRGGEGKERAERSSQESWGLCATGPERKVPGQEAPGGGQVKAQWGRHTATRL